MNNNRVTYLIFHYVFAPVRLQVFSMDAALSVSHSTTSHHNHPRSQQGPFSSL